MITNLKEVLNLERETLGELIKSIRKEMGINTVELANLADISKSYMYNIENGTQKSPKFEILIKLANAISENSAYTYSFLIRQFQQKLPNKNFEKQSYYFNANGELQEANSIPQKNMLDLRDILNVNNKIDTKYTFKELDHEHSVVLGKNIKQQILNVVDELVKMHVYNNPELLNNDEADNENVDWKISTNKLRIIEQHDVSNEDSDN